MTKNNKAYIINNEKLGVLIWYFLRCMSNHTSISNSIHIFLSVGKDSSSDYLDFLDITKIEIYSHDKKSYNDVMREYEDECIICIEYKQNGSGCIAFSNNIVEKLEYISDNHSDKFIPEDALLDFYRLFESGNNDAIINFLIAQLSLQLFHIGVSEWVDIYDIDLLSLYQHSITVAQQKQNGTYIEQNDDEKMDEDDEDEDEYEEEEETEEDEEDDSEDGAEDEEPEEEEEWEPQASSSYGEDEEIDVVNKYLDDDDEDYEDDDDDDIGITDATPMQQEQNETYIEPDDEDDNDNSLDKGLTQKSISPEIGTNNVSVDDDERMIMIMRRWR